VNADVFDIATVQHVKMYNGFGGNNMGGNLRYVHNWTRGASYNVSAGDHNKT